MCDTSVHYRKKGGRLGGTNGAGHTAQFQPLTSSSALSSDFDSEDELQIDESPPPRRRPALLGKKKLPGGFMYMLLVFFCLIKSFKTLLLNTFLLCSGSPQETPPSQTVL